MNKPILILAIGLLPSPLFARDSIFPQQGADSTASPAKSPPAFSASEWKRYDKNRDGVIAKREAGEMDTRAWTHADLNADGKITKKEWLAVSSNARTVRACQRADRENYGLLTRVEAISLDTATFTSIDADGDGLLSKKEWDSAGAQVTGVAGRAAPMFPDAK